MSAMNCGRWKYDAKRFLKVYKLTLKLRSMVGTCHVDLKGPERLKKFLNFVRPTSIAHESSKETAEEQMKQRFKTINQLLQEINHPDPETRLLNMVEYAYGYELWVPYQHKKEDNPTVKIYSLEDHANVEYLDQKIAEMEQNGEDVSMTSDTLLSNLDKIVEEGDIKAFQEAIDSIYADPCSSAGEICGFVKEYICEKREQDMEQKVREILVKDSAGTLVVICGAGHFFSDYENLYERLKDLSPCRIRLPEIDQF